MPRKSPTKSKAEKDNKEGKEKTTSVSSVSTKIRNLHGKLDEAIQLLTPYREGSKGRLDKIASEISFLEKSVQDKAMRESKAIQSALEEARTALTTFEDEIKLHQEKLNEFSKSHEEIVKVMASVKAKTAQQKALLEITVTKSTQIPTMLKTGQESINAVETSFRPLVKRMDELTKQIADPNTELDKLIKRLEKVGKEFNAFLKMTVQLNTPVPGPAAAAVAAAAAANAAGGRVAAVIPSVRFDAESRTRFLKLRELHAKNTGTLSAISACAFPDIPRDEKAAEPQTPKVAT